METYRKVSVKDRLPKEEGDYFTNFGIYHHFYDTPQDQAWWDNHVRFFFEPIEAPDPTAQLQADKEELLQALEGHKDALDLSNMDFYIKYGFNVAEVMPKTRVLIQKMKQ